MPALIVTTPAASRSLIGLAALKADLGITGTDHDDQLIRWSVEMSDVIADYCGVAVDQKGRRCMVEEAVTITARPEDMPRRHVPAPVILPWRVPLEVESVMLGGEVMDPAFYRIDPMGGLLWRLDGDGIAAFWPCTATLTITGKAGWALSDVPGNLSGAASALIKGRWYARERDPNLRSYQSPDVESMSWFDPDKIQASGGLPAEVAASLDSYRCPVLG